MAQFSPFLTKIIPDNFCFWPLFFCGFWVCFCWPLDSSFPIKYCYYTHSHFGLTRNEIATISFHLISFHFILFHLTFPLTFLFLIFSFSFPLLIRFVMLMSLKCVDFELKLIRKIGVALKHYSSDVTKFNR